ncbi:putative alpha-1,6-mannosyltransferase subunit, partial [Aspergillus violaceofuscus CBS 115571]
IPPTIHHLLLSMPNHPVSAFRPSQHTISWQQSGWKIEYWTEAACAQLAHATDPSGRYAAALAAFPSAVLKSDFCRYLILYARGGVYNDLDVRLLQPLPWGVMFGAPPYVPGDDPGDAPGSARDGPPAAIIGLEGDASTRGLPRSPQFVQWTMVAAPGHPIFGAVLGKIVERTEEYLQRLGEVDGGNDGVEPPDVMQWTGPSVWTDAVLEYFEAAEGMLQTLRDLQETVRIKDVVVLPKRGFAITQGEDHRSSAVLVKHYFSGTWKTGCRAVWRWI